MPEYRRKFRLGGMSFFTVVTQARRHLFAHEQGRSCLRSAIHQVQTRWLFEVTAIVLLPEHVHCLWQLPEGDAEYSIRWACIKRLFTLQWLAGGGAEAPVSPSRRRQRGRGIWQKRFWEHAIRDERDMIHHVNYIHYNAIKHGLVRCPHAWPHSSFHRWVKEGYYREDWLCECRAAPLVPADVLQMPSAGE